jgi:hypothetical protein
MKQLTKEQCVKIYESMLWEDLDDHQIIRLQLWQERLCMPLQVLKEALSRVLGRSVATHELGYERIKKEYLGELPPPTWEEVVALLPDDKTVILKSENDG